MCSKTARALVLSLSATSAIFFGITPAMASLTSMNGPYPGEDGLNQILAHQYGGVFSAAGSDFTNGTITAQRIDDANDQTWNAHFVSARVVGAFSAYAQSFGIFAGSSSGAYQKLFDVHGWGYNAVGSASNLSLSGTYRLARGGGGDLVSSKAGDNVDHKDRMVTYKVNGLSDRTNTYMVFFEDFHDFDYNDLSVQLKTAAGLPPPPDGKAVPLPAAVWMGLSTLAGTGVVGGARGLRRRMRASADVGSRAGLSSGAG
jgi:hypothetical protein